MTQAPRHLIPIPPTRDPEHLVRVINQRLRDLQLLMNEFTSARTQALDMGGQRVMNAGRAKVDTDLVTRKDLLDYAIFSPEGDTAISDKPLVARGGIRVPKKARMKDEVVTLEDLYNFIASFQQSGTLSGDVNGQFGSNVLSNTGVVPGTYGDGSEGFYKLVGNAMTIALAAGDRLDVYEWVAGGGPVYETFTGPATFVTLGMTPSIVIAEKNGVQQHNDGIGTAEGMYKLAGTTLTIQLATGDTLDVFEWA